MEHSDDDDDDDKWIINCSWSKRVKQQYQMMKKMINERDVVSSQFFCYFFPRNISTVAKLRKWKHTRKNNVISLIEGKPGDISIALKHFYLDLPEKTEFY